MATAQKNAFGDVIESPTVNAFGDPIEALSVNITPGMEKLGTQPSAANPPSPAGLAGPKPSYMQRVMTNLPSSLARMSPLNMPFGGGGEQGYVDEQGNPHAAPIGNPMDAARSVGRFLQHPIDTTVEAFANDPAGTLTAATTAGRAALQVPAAARAVARGGRAFAGPIPESTDPLERSSAAWEADRAKKAAAKSETTAGDMASSAIGVISPRWRHGLELAGNAKSALGAANIPARVKAGWEAMGTPEAPAYVPPPVTPGPQPTGQTFSSPTPTPPKSQIGYRPSRYPGPSGLPSVSGPPVPGYTPPPSPAPRGAPAWQSHPEPTPADYMDQGNIRDPYGLVNGKPVGPLPNRGGDNSLPRDVMNVENTPHQSAPPPVKLERTAPPRVTPQSLSSAAPVKVPGAVAQTVSAPEPVTAARLIGEEPITPEVRKYAEERVSQKLAADARGARFALSTGKHPDDVMAMSDTEFAAFKRSIPTGNVDSIGKPTRAGAKMADLRKDDFVQTMRNLMGEGLTVPGNPFR